MTIDNNMKKTKQTGGGREGDKTGKLEKTTRSSSVLGTKQSKNQTSGKKKHKKTHEITEEEDCTQVWRARR